MTIKEWMVIFLCLIPWSYVMARMVTRGVIRSLNERDSNHVEEA